MASRRETPTSGTGILFEEPNPTGSRPSDLIGLYRKWQREGGREVTVTSRLDRQQDKERQRKTEEKERRREGEKRGKVGFIEKTAMRHRWRG